jgi:catechol 2,3-dioxygenase-like lactoylglutathione lyase family enzyme
VRLEDTVLTDALPTVTIPILPCRDVDEIVAFYEALGFTRTYRQLRPNPYVALQRGDLNLHFFGLPTFDPATSLGSCIVQVADADTLYRAFAAGLRAAYGKLPATGIPRVTRPRKRLDAVHGFSVVDPGGNWIRVSQLKGASLGDSKGEAPATGLARVLESAVSLGDSKGDAPAAARLLDAALARVEARVPRELLPVLVYRAELALATNDPATARARLAEARALPLDDADRDALADTLERLGELEGELLG